MIRNLPWKISLILLLTTSAIGFAQTDTISDSTKSKYRFRGKFDLRAGSSGNYYTDSEISLANDKRYIKLSYYAIDRMNHYNTSTDFTSAFSSKPQAAEYPYIYFYDRYDILNRPAGLARNKSLYFSYKESFNPKTSLDNSFSYSDSRITNTLHTASTLYLNENTTQHLRENHTLATPSSRLSWYTHFVHKNPTGSSVTFLQHLSYANMNYTLNSFGTQAYNADSLFSIINYNSQHALANFSLKDNLYYSYTSKKSERGFNLSLNSDYNRLKATQHFGYAQNNPDSSFNPTDTLLTDMFLNSESLTGTFLTRNLVNKKLFIDFKYVVRYNRFVTDQNTTSEKTSLQNSLLSTNFKTHQVIHNPAFYVEYEFGKHSIGGHVGYIYFSRNTQASFPEESVIKIRSQTPAGNIYYAFGNTDKDFDITVSYGYELEEFSPRDFLPVSTFFHPLFVYSGNAALNTALSHKAGFYFNKEYKNKLKIGVSVNYRSIQNYVTQNLLTSALYPENALNFDFLPGALRIKTENSRMQQVVQQFELILPAASSKTGYEISNFTRISELPVLINDVLNTKILLTSQSQAILSKRIHKIRSTLRVGYIFTYTSLASSLATEDLKEYDFALHEGLFSLRCDLRKIKLTGFAELKYINRQSLSAGFQDDMYLLNVDFSYTLTDNYDAIFKQIIVKTGCFDLLDQNNKIYRTLTPYSSTDYTSRVIPRHLYLGINFSF